MAPAKCTLSTSPGQEGKGQWEISTTGNFSSETISYDQKI